MDNQKEYYVRSVMGVPNVSIALLYAMTQDNLEVTVGVGHAANGLPWYT